jgi:ribonuclease HII
MALRLACVERPRPLAARRMTGHDGGNHMRGIVGIDEAGRGPLAGPVAVGVVVTSQKFNTKFFKGIKDSKKLSTQKREEWYVLALEARKRGELDFHVALISEKVIDKQGISAAIRLGVARGLAKVGVRPRDQIFLDGSLKAPQEFKNQKTIIKGDEKIAVISLASICAKVTRDKKMVALAKKFPHFSFDIHKGYGTRAHLQALRKYGLTTVHRRSFLKRLTKG